MTRTLFAILLLSLAACAGPTRAPEPKPQVRLQTTQGDIVIELEPDRAPISTANFLRYVDEGAYDGTIFHRVIPGFVVQAGGHTPDLAELEGHEPIKNEWRNGLKNVRGSVGMARETDPDSATRQWYINLADNDRLDEARETTGNAGYAVFGHVVEGMDVVDYIASAPTSGRPDLGMANIPVTPIVITSARRVAPEGAEDATVP
jgi:cyclophilin family peptidyl-prolyl cis-trans isomerase